MTSMKVMLEKSAKLEPEPGTKSANRKSTLNGVDCPAILKPSCECPVGEKTTTLKLSVALLNRKSNRNRSSPLKSAPPGAYTMSNRCVVPAIVVRKRLPEPTSTCPKMG